MPMWVQLRAALGRFTFSDSLALAALKGLSHVENSFLVVSHFSTITTIYIFYLHVGSQRVTDPCNNTMESEGMRMRIIVLPHLQKSDTGITPMTKMCLLLPRCVERELPLPEGLPPYASSDAKWDN